MSEFQRRLERRDDVLARRYDYGDESVFVADIGAAKDGYVDVVDGTLIVVADDEQKEFDLPADEARASMNNGIVTVEVTESDA